MHEILSKRKLQLFFYFTAPVYTRLQYSSQPQQNVVYEALTTGASPVLSQLPVQQQTTRDTYPQPPTTGLYTGPPSYDDFLKNENKYWIHDSPAETKEERI